MGLTKNRLQIFITVVFLGFAIWWATLQPDLEAQGLSVQWFGGTYGLMALIGSIIGFIAAQKWGGFRTVLGKSLMFFSFGLLAQEIGQLIYTYYVYGAKVEIPYPSLGDAAYFGSVLLYIYAAILLAKATGVKNSLAKTTEHKLVAICVPLALLATTYLVFLHDHQYDWHKPLTVFLDFGYPTGQAIYISLAVIAYLLSRKSLGGLMRPGILLIIFALCAQYVADFSFLYQSSRGTYMAGGLVDLVYLFAYFAMATALLEFRTIYQHLKVPKNTPVTSETASAKVEK